MKKILLTLGALLMLTNAGFASHSFAANKAVLSIIRDKDNQEWCAFPDQTPQQDGILDEHKQLAKEGKEKNEWILCSDFKIDKTDSKTIEQYDLKSLSGTAWLKGRMICLKNGEEIQCSEKKSSLSSGSDRTVNKSSINSSGSSLGECKVNGKPVDCEEMMQEFGGFLKAGLWIMLGFGALSLVCFVFWIIMLVHACSNNIPNKVLWIVLLFLFGIIAAIVYYFVVKRHCVTNYVPPANTQPYQASVTVGYHEGPVATTPFVAPTPPTTTPIQTVESMIATSGAETMSQTPLESNSSVAPTIASNQNNTPVQNPPSTNA